MKSNTPFDPRIHSVGLTNTRPAPIHIQKVMFNQIPPHQNFIHRPNMTQPIPNYIFQSPSPYPQQQNPIHHSYDQTKASRYQAGPKDSLKPNSVPVVHPEAYVTKNSQNQSQHLYQQYQGEQQYQQQYAGGEQQDIKNQQIIIFWQHKFYTIFERFKLMFQKVQWIRSQFYNLNNELKAVDSQQEWNQAKEHHQDFMEQLQQFSQELAGVINQNANLAEQGQNEQKQHNIWKDRYFQLFQGYKTMQQQLFSVKQGKTQDGDRIYDSKVTQILANYRQIQRQYTQVLNQLNQTRQNKQRKIGDTFDKSYTQKLDFAMRQAEKYKETLDQLHKQKQQMVAIVQQLKQQKHKLQNKLKQNNHINHQHNYQQFSRAINERDQQINLLNKQLKQLSEKYNFLVEAHNSSQGRFKDDQKRIKSRILQFEKQIELKNMEILQFKAKLHQTELKQKSAISISEQYQRMLKLKLNELQQRYNEIQRLRKQIIGLRQEDSKKDMNLIRKQYDSKVKIIEEQYSQKLQQLKKKLRKKQQQIENTALLNIKLESIQKKNKMLLHQIQSLSNQLHLKEKQSIQCKKTSNVQQKVKELEYLYNVTLQQKQRLNTVLLQRNFYIETLQEQISQFQSRIRNIGQNSQTTSSKPLMYEIQELSKIMQLKENQINKLKANICLKQGINSQLQDQIYKLKNKIITSQKQYSKQKDILIQNFRVLQRKNQQNQKRMRQLQFQYGSIMRKNLQDQIQNLRIQNKKKQQNIIGLQTEQLQLRSKISHYQRIRSVHGSDIQQLTNRIKQLEISKCDMIKKVQNAFRDVKNKQKQNKQLVETVKNYKDNIIKLENTVAQNEKAVTEKQKLILNLQEQILIANSKLSYITQEHENLRLRTRNQTDIMTKQSQDLRKKLFQYEHLNSSKKEFKDKFSTQITKIQNQMIIQLEQQKQFLKSQLEAALQQLGKLPSQNKKNNSNTKLQKSYQGIQYIQKRLFDFNTKLDEIIIKNKQISNQGFASNIANWEYSTKGNNIQNQQYVKNLKAQIRQLRKYISKLQVQIAGQVNKNNPIAEIIYQGQEKAYKERIQFYEQQTNELESRIENLIKVNTNLKERVESLLKDNGNSSVINFYKSQLSISEETIQNLHIKINKLLQENRNLKSNNNQQTTKMYRGYQDKIFEYQNKIFILERKLNNYELQRNRYQNERLDLQKNLNLVKNELQSLKYSSEKQIQASKKNNSELAQQIVKYENETYDLLEKLRILESQNSRITQTVEKNFTHQHIFINTPVKYIT